MSAVGAGASCKMFRPQATISPSAVFISRQGILCPAAPIFQRPGRVKVIIGAASGKPQPYSTSKPRVLKSLGTSSSSFVPPRQSIFRPNR